MIHAEHNPAANVAPGEGERFGDIVPTDEGVFADSGRWPRIDRRLAYEEAAYQAEVDEARIGALMAEETARQEAEDDWDQRADKAGSYYLAGNPEQRRMLDERARSFGEVTVHAVSPLVTDRTDRDVAQPLRPGIDDDQIAVNQAGLARVRAALAKK